MAHAPPISRPQISRYALYGEGLAQIAPEFMHIEPISERSALHDWTISPHAHPGIYQLLLLQAGSGVLAVDGAEAALTPQTLVAVPPGCVHAFRFSADAEGWVLSLATDLLHDPRISALCDVARMAGAQSRWRQLEPEGDAAGRLDWLLADLDRMLTGPRSGTIAHPVAAQLALILALAEDALAAGANAPGSGSRRDRLALLFSDLVEAHFRDGWSVADYARRLGASSVTLTRACRDAFAKPPGEVILDRLLLEAMRSLTYTVSGVGQIAEDLGFVDPAYFARFFRKRTGMTASAFRATRAWFRAHAL